MTVAVPPPRTVAVDFLLESGDRYGVGWCAVVVDVLRATSTAQTAVASGRRCLLAADELSARRLRDQVQGALLAGEKGGLVPTGFDLGNSPAQVAARSEVERPVVLTSSSGVPLALRAAAAGADPVLLGSLRNIRAQVRWLLQHGGPVVLLGAGTGRERRLEDQYACALLAAGLLAAGWSPAPGTGELVERLAGLPAEVVLESPSAAFLRRTDQTADLDHVLSHVDDLDDVYRLDGAELVAEPAA